MNGPFDADFYQITKKAFMILTPSYDTMVQEKAGLNFQHVLAVIGSNILFHE